jgi:6-pyruvoyl-tetrahydropterin synthase
VNTVSVKLRFAAGHRILNLPGPGAKCSNPHGHNYTAVFTFAQPPGWPLHVEFGLVKSCLGDWIKDNLDHGFMVHEEDVFLTYLAENGLKFYALTTPPTTEAVANELAMAAQELFPGYILACVVVDEGPDNTATWWPSAHRKGEA